MIVTGKSKAISTVKIRNWNHSENGSHADLLGSNTHSNGERFSWSSMVFSIGLLELYNCG
jgi:hypothetical protein